MNLGMYSIFRQNPYLYIYLLYMYFIVFCMHSCVSIDAMSVSDFPKPFANAASFHAMQVTTYGSG